MIKRFQAILFLFLMAVSPLCAAQRDRITSPIIDSETVALKGSVSALAKHENDLGPLDLTTKLPYVTMLLNSSPEQEAARKQLLEDQQNPNSPDYHKWLTPEQYADRFGVSRADIATIRRWLRQQGFKIVEVARGRNWIAFSGSVGQIETAFHTQIHWFTVDGEERFSNVNAPSVPKALEGIVSGFRGLDNFKPKSLMMRKDSAKVTPDYNDGSGHSLAPDDIATIYGITALYTAGIDGTGMKIAIMGQTDVHMTDIEQFRAGFNLSANDPTPVLATGCTDPGFTGDEGEADLDLEWSGAVARNASITYVVCDTNTNKGVLTSIQYAVNNNTAPVISMSYGGCEANFGQSFATSYDQLLKQANAQGQTVMVSSGDASAATCDNQNTEQIATLGLAVNGLASPPEATAVGGTEFDADVNNAGTYWNSTNGANGGSAIQYIPELAWNDGTLGTNLNGGLWGTGGGASIYFAKPVWQTGTGVPNDNARDVPDVAMTASGAHDGYIFCTTGSCANGIAQNTARVGGTSASAPVFAGVITLLNHYLNKTKGTAPGQGNINPKLYALAASTPSAFHDIPAGNYSLTATPSGNMVPCQSSPATPNCPASAPFQFGFASGTGYDQATGLGSVDANLLVNNWVGSGLTPTTTTLSIAPQSTVNVGTTVTFTATIAPAPPNGETVTFKDQTSSTTLGTQTTTSGQAILTTSTIPAGSYSVVASYPGDTTLAASVSSASPLTVTTKTATTTTLLISPATVAVGNNVTFTATITPAPPNGETVTFKDQTSNTTLGTQTTTSGQAILTTSTNPAGSYSVVASYPGDTTLAASVSSASPLTVTKVTTATTLSISPQATVPAGSNVTLTATITPAPPNGETVTFKDQTSGSTLGTGTTTSGQAVFTSSTIPLGSYSVVASYPGDTTLAASVSVASPLTVTKITTSTAVSISPQTTVAAGTSVSITATITPAPPAGETVTFTDKASGTTLGTAQTATGGTAVLTKMTGSGTGQIAGGAYNVVASYPGDATMQSSSSGGTALSIQDFTLSPTSLSITISAPGQNGSGTINFSLLGGLSQAPSFTCSGLPSESSCTFAAASTTSETVTIGTTAATWLHGDPLGRGRTFYYALVLPGLIGFVWPAGKRKRSWRAILVLVIMLVAFTMWMPACGGSNSSSGGGHHDPGTPVGQANVTVTATESNVTHTIAVSLNVQ